MSLVGCDANICPCECKAPVHFLAAKRLFVICCVIMVARYFLQFFYDCWNLLILHVHPYDVTEDIGLLGMYTKEFIETYKLILWLKCTIRLFIIVLGPYLTFLFVKPVIKKVDWCHHERYMYRMRTIRR